MSWALLTRAERDGAYNNGAAVANSAELIRVRNEQSALFRAAHVGHLDLPYGPEARQQWDLYPAADPTAPCLVFIHGGYWQMNRREDFAMFAQGPRAAGWAAALPGYRLAPDASLADIATELRTALDWLMVHGPAHGMAGPVILAGWSAGGHLAALLLDHAAVTAGLAISGVFELAPLRDTYLNDKLQLTQAQIDALSPLRLAVVQKPLAIAYGSRELPALVADSRNFHGRRAAAHAPGALLPVAGADHFTILDGLGTAGGDLMRLAATLIAQ